MGPMSVYLYRQLICCSWHNNSIFIDNSLSLKVRFEEFAKLFDKEGVVERLAVLIKGVPLDHFQVTFEVYFLEGLRVVDLFTYVGKQDDLHARAHLKDGVSEVVGDQVTEVRDWLRGKGLAKALEAFRNTIYVLETILLQQLIKRKFVIDHSFRKVPVEYELFITLEDD